MACTGGDGGETPLAPISFGSDVNASSSFAFPYGHRASTTPPSFSSPATPTPFRTPCQYLPIPTTPFFSAGTMSQEFPGSALPSDDGETSSLASPPPSLQDFVPEAAKVEKNIYTGVIWNRFKTMMTGRINQRGKQVVLKQRANDEVDLKELPIQDLRHLCSVNGLKYENEDTKDNLLSILKKLKEKLLSKSTEDQHFKKKENMEDDEEFDQRIEQAKFRCEQAKLELAQTEDGEKELQDLCLKIRVKEETIASINPQLLQARNRRFEGTQLKSQRPTKIAPRATEGCAARRPALH